MGSEDSAQNSRPPIFGFPQDMRGVYEAALGEKLDQMYMDFKATGEMKTTEIPISMLLSLDSIASRQSILETGSLTQAPPGYKSELTAHLRRVAAYAQLLALKYGLSMEEAKLVAQVSPIHDIGKWMIPAHILQKPSALDAGEWEIMKSHALAGYEILKDSKVEVLQMASIVAIQHHEKYDGSGYPSGLKGQEIHIYSRITTVADVFDALGSARSYKKSWADTEIVEYFRANRETHFDPDLVDILLQHLQDFVDLRRNLGGGSGVKS